MLVGTNFGFDILLHSKVVVLMINSIMNNCNEEPCWSLENDKIHKDHQVRVLASNTGALLGEVVF